MNPRFKAVGTLVSVDRRTFQRKDGSGDVTFASVLVVGSDTLASIQVDEKEAVHLDDLIGTHVTVPVEVSSYRNTPQLRAIGPVVSA